MSSEEPNIGTWRPHKPRGPVAAFQRSPGPKYTLPGLTGTFQHDPTKCKAPAFSFGGYHKKGDTNCSPGPRYLIPTNITREGRGGTPAFSLQSRPKELEKFHVPGPAHYSPECSGGRTFYSAPAYSFTGRRKEDFKKDTPGPGTYTLPPLLGSQAVLTPSAPKYSLSGRSKSGSFHEDLCKSPGPAAYEVVNPYTYRQKPPQFSMLGRNFVPDAATENPGPGAHYTERVTFTRAKAPSFSFGLRHSEYMLPVFVNVD